MANTPLSLRLDPETYERLKRSAQGFQRPVATHAADLIKAGLSGVPLAPVVVESTLLDDVIAMFENLNGVDVGTRRSAALVLVKVASAGGAAAVAAIKELGRISDEIDELHQRKRRH
jgi:hypothetical protein